VSEPEAVLLARLAIVDAAAIGIKQQGVHEGSELPRVYVVRRPDPEDDELTEQDGYDAVKAKLTKYKWLEGGVKFVDVIPRNLSGKILKGALRERAEKEMEAKL
jgi:4-coumarate--CoA ligase